MFTNNYDILNTLLATGGISYTMIDFSNVGTLKNTEGSSHTRVQINGKPLCHSIYTTPFTACGQATTYNSTSPTYVCIYLGTGTTEPTKDDYKMENPLTSTQLNVLEHDITYNITNTDGKIVKTININASIKNRSGSALSISEFGLTQFARPDGSFYINQFLLYRETFEPIIIEPDGLFSFTKTITFEGNA